MKPALEGNALILGGVEVHVRFVRHKGDPGIVLKFTPPYGNDDVPDWMEDIDNRLAHLSRQTVMSSKTCGLLKIRGHAPHHHEDHARTRLLNLTERDGGKDRMILPHSYDCLLRVISGSDRYKDRRCYFHISKNHFLCFMNDD